MKDERGLTLVELLVALSILSVVTMGFYSVMIAGTRSSQDARSVSRISEEARLGLTRLVRDTREAKSMHLTQAPTATSYRILVDFNGDNVITEHPGTNSAGDYEDLTFSYHADSQTIRLNGVILIGGVTPIPGQDMFTYSSHRLEYDSDADGTVTLAELQAAQDANAAVPDPIWANVTEIGFAFNVTNGGRTTAFNSETQLRNRR